MKANLIVSTLALLLLTSFTGMAQGERKIELGNKFFEAFDYTEAIYYYELAYEKDSKNPHITRRIAQSYRALGDLQSSVEWYEKTLFMDKSQPMDMLHLAEGLKTQGKYPQAINWYKKFAEKAPGDRRTQLHLLDTLYYSKLDRKADEVNVRSLGINDDQPAFGIASYEEDFIFSSPGESGFGVQEKNTWNNLPYLDLYVGEKGNNNELVNIRPLDPALNSRFHDGPASFDATTKTIFITRNNVVDGKPVRDLTGTVNLKIYQAKRENASWSEVRELPFNSDEYSNAHPCISYDGQTLYFISNRPGGFGGTDIYRSMRSGDGWTKPENLGPTVNTEGNEMFPYIYTDGSLYFASDGHAGLGGLDIFRSVASSDGFVQAANLGSPYSTKGDDFSLILNTDGNTGYFSTNRSGGPGNDDIFWFEDRSGANQTLVAKLLGLELAAGKPYVKVFSPNTGQTEMVAVDDKGHFSFPGTAGYKYEFSYKDRNGEKPLSAWTVPNPNTEPLHNLGDFRVYEDTLVVDKEPVVTQKPDKTEPVVPVVKPDTKPEIPDYTTIDLLETLKLNNVYFDYNSSAIRNDAINTMNAVVEIMRENPAFRLEISAHTDPRGSSDYNKALSRKRAEAARDYLLSRGISENRIVMNWFGSSKPAADCPPGVNCDEYIYQMNRRAEFKIIKE